MVKVEIRTFIEVRCDLLRWDAIWWAFPEYKLPSNHDMVSCEMRWLIVRWWLMMVDCEMMVDDGNLCLGKVGEYS